MFLKQHWKDTEMLIVTLVLVFRKGPPPIFVVIIYIEQCDEAEIKNRIKMVLK